MEERELVYPWSPEKYKDLTKVPLKSYEVAPGVRRVCLGNDLLRYPAVEALRATRADDKLWNNLKLKENNLI